MKPQKDRAVSQLQQHLKSARRKTNSPSSCRKKSDYDTETNSVSLRIQQSSHNLQKQILNIKEESKNQKNDVSFRGSDRERNNSDEDLNSINEEQDDQYSHI